MNLNNPNFISFGGDPITGRFPTRMEIVGALTQQQYGGVIHAYKLFCDMTNLALGDYQVQNRTLADGTKIRMVSINKNDTVYVSQPPVTGGSKLPHGFGVVMAKKARVIYGRQQNGDTNLWKVVFTSPPQLAHVTKNSAYSVKYTMLGSVDALALRPHITSGNNLWEFMKHGLTDFGDKLVVPFSPTYNPGSGPLVANLMDFVADKVYSSTGAELGASRIPTRIRADGSDTVVVMPPVISMDDCYVGLQAYSYGIISYTRSIYQCKYVLTILHRNGPSSYSRTESPETSWIVAPDTNHVEGVYSGSGVGCGLYNGTITNDGASIAFGPNTSGHIDPKFSAYIQSLAGAYGTGLSWTKYRQETAGYYMYGDWINGSMTVIDGGSMVVYVNYDYGEDRNTSVSFEKYGWYEAYLGKRSPAPDPINMCTVGGGSDLTQLQTVDNISYPTLRKFFRAGSEKVFSWPTYGTYAYWYYLWIECINSEHWVETPKGDDDGVILTFPWRKNPIKLFDPQAKGTLVGRYRYYWGLIRTHNYEGDRPSIKELPDRTQLDSENLEAFSPPGHSVGEVFEIGHQFYDAVLEKNINLKIDKWLSDAYRDNYSGTHGTVEPRRPDPTFEDYNPNGESPELCNQLCINKVVYEYTSRYIIDCDVPARFVAYLTVKVKCENYESRSHSVTRQDLLDVLTPARYTVTISFDCEWLPTLSEEKTEPIAATKQLYTGTYERPSFEFQELIAASPWIADNELRYKMPPVVNPPIEFYSQLKNITREQGQNPCFAGASNQPVTPLMKKSMESTAGVEFSQTNEAGALVKGISKYSPGMLYAREIKLTDFKDALWLLSLTKCDAQENDTAGPLYFYMPSLGAAVSSDAVFDIQVRDGVLVKWSDDIPDLPDAPDLPDGMKKINLYRI